MPAAINGDAAAHRPAGSAASRAEAVEAEEHAEAVAVQPFSGDWYTLASFGRLRLSIGYYIDALTVVMFTMVTLIATCIHVYAIGYMHDELHESPTTK